MSDSSAGQAQGGPPTGELSLEEQAELERQRHLLVDARTGAELNEMALRPMMRIGRAFWPAVGFLGLLVLAWWVTWGFQMWWNVGITGMNRVIMWSLYIANYVYLIGIAEAGTFIAAALRLLDVDWRRPITRIAEMLTVFCIFASALFPLVHLGRTWKLYWLLPYPNERQIWPNFRSPLIWDLTATLSYLFTSTLFFYVDLIPDAAVARDHVPGWRGTLNKWLALGWRGTERQWKLLKTTQLIFSIGILLIMPSVHTIVSYDFAMTIQPGWHSSVFGPYFVSGAIFSGVAAIIIAAIIFRQTNHWGYFIRDEHLNGLGIFLLLTSLIWDYFFFQDFIVPWYGQLPGDKEVLLTMMAGRGQLAFWLMISANTIVPFFALWWRRVRTSWPAMLAISLFIELGLLLERYIIVTVDLGVRELPFDWGSYSPRAAELIITTGAVAFIVLGFVVFAKLIPFVVLYEIKEGQLLVQLRRVGKGLIRGREE
jgi:Ni/Fe-hydrogenase subunit HybB-like protein